MKIAILTCFMSFPAGYSLTGIVRDQVVMLNKYGHDVHVFVNEKFNNSDSKSNIELPEYTKIEKKIPFTHLTDYHAMADISAEHKLVKNNTSVMLQNELKDYDIVFTHDFLFTGWNLPYGLACVEASKNADLKNVRWMHWVHSIPSAGYDWWNSRFFGGYHKIIYPNDTDRLRVAEAYRGRINDVRVIPHIKDLRTLCAFSQESIEYLDFYPDIMKNDIVQVYPASVDRLKAKGIHELISIFSNFKRMGYSVCLVIANQWATGKQQREDTEVYKKLASREDLKVGHDLIFTSDYDKGKYGVGIPQKMLRELFMCSNLFIFPTREESFGLALPEAVLAGGVLPVLNKSLTMQTEVSGFNALYFNFGSYENAFSPEVPELYYRDLASIILGRLQQSESLLSKTYMRQRYNYDNIYNKYYAPVMAESSLWL